MANFFIRRPIVAIVIAIIIVLLGLNSLRGLSFEQYPFLAPPTIRVTANYPGASAVAVEQSVATPIEQEVNGVEGMIYMKSSNTSDGRMQLDVNFQVGTNQDMANVLTQNRVSSAQARLPQEVVQQGVTVKKQSPSILMLISLYSPKGSYDANFLINYCGINVRDQLLRIPGIAQVDLFGGTDYGMRIWLRPDKLGKYGLTPSDVMSAIKEQNLQAPAGRIGMRPSPKDQEFTYTVSAPSRLVTEDEFANIIIRESETGGTIRIKDVGRVELGSQDYNSFGRLDGKPAGAMAVYLLPGANQLKASEAIYETMRTAKSFFPTDMDYKIVYDTTPAVEASIESIFHTFLEAIVLVTLVVFIFLQNLRATIIPLLTVPVSLIGTFIFFPMLGFSVNTLSMFGLVLAIGIVVDDAIVVVEAVMHHIEHGMSPKDATVQAMKEVSAPVIGIALILSAVFVPVAFIPGLTGQMYQQFALTIAISVLLSAFSALSLSPALAAMLLKPAKPAKGIVGKFFGGFNKAFEWTTNGYVKGAQILVRRSILTIGVVVLVAVGAGLFGGALPAGFIPEEDQGIFGINVTLPPAASLERTSAVLAQVEEILSKTEGVQSYQTIGGYGVVTSTYQPNFGTIFIRLTPWEDRHGAEMHVRGFMARIQAQVARIPDAVIFPFNIPTISGFGASAGFNFLLQDRSGSLSVEQLGELSRQFIEAARKRPEIGNIFTSFDPRYPQVKVELDREKARKLGVPVNEAFQALASSLGGSYVNDFNRFGRLFRVYVQSEADYRRKPEDIDDIWVRSKTTNEMIPLGTLVTITAKGGTELTNRFNLLRSVEFNGVPSRGYASGQALDALDEVFKTTMPPEMGYAYSQLSYQEKTAPPATPTLVAAIVFVFLLLAALYESWRLPWAVLLGSPLVALGAFFGVWLAGFDNNVYVQIGNIMLIGLAAKNAILIVEFAKAKQEEGMSFEEAALTSARLRFRPILMTAFAFILGVVPLMKASGAGAGAQNVMGTAVFFGMLVATAFGVFLIPGNYTFVESLGRKKKHAAAEVPPKPAPSPGEGTEMARRLIAVVLPLLLAGCMVGPNYKRPEVPTPPAWRTIPVAEAESLANTAWWEVFDDPQLQELIHIALVENKDLKIAVERIEEARARYGFAKADLWPKFDASATAGAVRFNSGSLVHTPEGDQPPGEPIQTGIYAVSVDVSWELDFFGRIRRVSEAQQALFLGTEEARRATVLALVADVARSYFELRDLDRRLEISRRTIESRREYVQFAKDRFEGGITPEIDYRQAEAELRRVESVVFDLERLIALKENEISVLLGRNPGDVLRGRAVDAQQLPAAVPAGLPSELLDRRPDIRAAEENLAAATADIGAAKALLYPRIALTGSYGVTSTDLDTLFDAPSRAWNIVGNLLQPIFHFGQNKRRVEVRESQQRQLLYAYERTILEAFRETDDALVSYQKTGEGRTAQAERVKAERKVLELAELRYRGGVTAYLEVLDAQRSLFNAELDEAQSIGGHLVSLVRLYKALGGGWPQAPEPPPASDGATAK